MKKIIATVIALTGISCIVCAETAIEQLGLTPERVEMMQVPVVSKASRVTVKAQKTRSLLTFDKVTIRQTRRINKNTLEVTFNAPGKSSMRAVIQTVGDVILDMNLLKEGEDETILFIDRESGVINGYVIPMPAPHDDLLMWVPKPGALSSAYIVRNAMVGQPTQSQYGTVAYIKGGKISALAVVPPQLLKVVKKHADRPSSRTPVVILGLRSVLDGVGEIWGIYDNGVILIPDWD